MAYEYKPINPCFKWLAVSGSHRGPTD